MEKVPLFARLSFRMILLVTLLATAPLLFYGLQFIGSYRDSILQNASDLNLQTAERAADRIEMSLATMDEYLSRTAQQRCFRTANVREQISAMQFLVHRNPGINSLTSVDSEMNILAAVCERHVDLQRDSVYEASSDLLEWEHAGLYYGQLTISDTGERELELVIPVMDFQQAGISGYLIAVISVHDLLADIIRMDINSDIALSVTSRTGHLIAHADYSRVLKGENWSSNPHIAHFLENSEDNGTEHHESAHSFVNQSGERVIGAAAVVASTGWVVYCEEMESVAFAPVSAATNKLRLVLAAILCAAVILIVYMTRLLTRPVNQLIRSAEIVGAGDLQHRTGITSKSEMGVLAAAFDGMTANLQNSTASIDDLNREKELREAQWQRIMTILNNIPDVLYIADPDTYEVIFVNKVFQDMLGEDPVGKICHKAFHNLDEPCSFCTNDRILKTMEPYVWEFHNKTINRDFIITDQIIKWPDGRNLRFEIAKDITKYKKTEIEKEKLTQYFQAMLSNTNIWIEVLDERGELSYWSLGAEAISGYSFHAMKELPDRDKPSVSASFEFFNRPSTDNDSETTFKKEIVCKDGSVKTILGVSTPLTDSSNTVTGRITVCRDITEMQQMHETVLVQKAVTDSVIESLPGLFYQISSKNRFVRWNRHMARVTERSDEEMASISPLEIFPNEEKELVGGKIAGLFEKGGQDTVYASVLSRSGRKIPHLLTGTMREIKGETFLIGMGIDISDLKETQEELERSNKELSQFAYVASHDLQEPLRMVASYTQLLQQRYSDVLDDDAKEFIHFAVDGATRMQKLIRDLLKFSRINTRTSDFRIVSMNEVISEALGNMKVSLEESAAEVVFDALPQVEGDYSQLVQLMQNLISNAVKFRSRKDPKVTIASAREGHFWEFSVTDNGIGIREEYFEKVFVIFKRLHGREKYEGTGIGLAICKRIVGRHGGRIWPTANRQEGTTFHFTLPAVSEKDEKNEN